MRQRQKERVRGKETGRGREKGERGDRFAQDKKKLRNTTLTPWLPLPPTPQSLHPGIGKIIMSYNEDDP